MRVDRAEPSTVRVPTDAFARGAGQADLRPSCSVEQPGRVVLASLFFDAVIKPARLAHSIVLGINTISGSCQDQKREEVGLSWLSERKFVEAVWRSA